jgi:hypothetical protein
MKPPTIVKIEASATFGSSLYSRQRQQRKSPKSIRKCLLGAFPKFERRRQAPLNKENISPKSGEALI